jgi:hypothetical protein
MEGVNTGSVTEVICVTDFLEIRYNFFNTYTSSNEIIMSGDIIFLVRGV